MNLELPHPLIVGASPLVEDLDTVRRVEDAGAAAIVMNSLFEEQIFIEQIMAHEHIEQIGDSFAEAASYLPDPAIFMHGPEQYMEQIAAIKAAVDIPVIASLNGTTPGGWLRHALLMEEAGADGLELNVYDLTSDPETSSSEIEQRTLTMVRELKAGLRIPVAIKLSPFYTSLAHFALALERCGVDAIVLFNRFYQPEIDPNTLSVDRTLQFSTPDELALRLRWIAIFSGRLQTSLGVTGGVHGANDAIKAVMAGAHGVQIVSALLKFGVEHLDKIRCGMIEWMEANEYESLAQMQGCMNLEHCPDPEAYERANYMRMLQGWSA